MNSSLDRLILETRQKLEAPKPKPKVERAPSVMVEILIRAEYAMARAGAK
jgi:hypothetical protein